jgi:hypothetical protein
MRTKWAIGLAAMGLIVSAPVAVSADDPAVIPLSKEPHHHIQLHNDYVNVYKVSVEPGDTVLLHKHFYDAISVMIQPASVTVHSPGKPDAKQELTAAQVRLQPNGYTHSTEIAASSQPYRNVTLELIMTQGGLRNLCTAAVAGQPLNCPASPDSTASSDTPQFESDLTRITLTRIKPGQSVKLGSATDNELFVMLDDATASPAAGSNAVKQLHSEDFMWLEKGSSGTVLHNTGTSEAKFVLFVLKPKS